MKNTILIIEDELLIAQEMEQHFLRNKWRVVMADNLSDARHQLQVQGFNPLIVISDMNLPDGNALDLFEEIGNDSEWIFVTGYGTVTDSVRALRLGAFDYLEKPINYPRLDIVVAGATRSIRATRRLNDEIRQASNVYALESFVGKSAAARNVRDFLSQLSAAPIKALIISGETGTGKGISARILHHNSLRRKGRLVEVNCSALPKDLIESELFGHEPGSFTGATGKRRGLMEQADGGTLFLDEIGEMPAALQAKLLKVIEEQSFRRVGGEREINVDVQIIAASNRDLSRLVTEHAFREDLYHRLNVFNLHLPPLRDRIEDLDVLVPACLAEFNAKLGKNVQVIPEKVWEKMRSHRWSGNIRELRNVIERCVMFAQSEVFPVKWLQLDLPERGDEASHSKMHQADPPSRAVNADCLNFPLDGSLKLEDIDRLVIETVLERHNKNVVAAARALGTTRDTLRYRIHKYGIDVGHGIE